MNKPQITTTGGLAGLVASVQSIAGLFQGKSLGDIPAALAGIEISEAITTSMGLLVSLWAIFYNEDKNK